MASHDEYTGTNCEFGHPTYYQVIEMRAWGGENLGRRRGPTCWYADCEAHQRWKQLEQNAS